MSTQTPHSSVAALAIYEEALERLRAKAHVHFAEQQDLGPILVALKVVPGSM